MKTRSCYQLKQQEETAKRKKAELKKDSCKKNEIYESPFTNSNKSPLAKSKRVKENEKVIVKGRTSQVTKTDIKNLKSVVTVLNEKVKSPLRNQKSQKRKQKNNLMGVESEIIRTNPKDIKYEENIKFKPRNKSLGKKISAGDGVVVRKRIETIKGEYSKKVGVEDRQFNSKREVKVKRYLSKKRSGGVRKTALSVGKVRFVIQPKKKSQDKLYFRLEKERKLFEKSKTKEKRFPQLDFEIKNYLVTCFKLTYGYKYIKLFVL